jgi:NAD(P)H-dependent FMN reductase
MTAPVKLLAFAGSTRKESFNKKLVKIAAEGARKSGADVFYFDLRDYMLPLYDADFEQESGLPAGALALKKLFLEHDGFLISCPEYNSSITPVLKNTIDWLSRPNAGETPLQCFTGKTAALMSASPGALGGLRALVHVRAILGNINTLLLPEQWAISKAHEAFNADGSLKDTKMHAAVEGLGAKLASVAGKLKG